MAIKEFHEWIKTNKNFKENNGENPQFKSSVLAMKFPKFKEALDSISTLNPEDVEAIIRELIPAIQQKAHKSSSAILNMSKQALNPAGRNEPTVGGAPEVK